MTCAQLLEDTHIQDRTGDIAGIADGISDNDLRIDDYVPLILCSGFLCQTFDHFGLRSDSIAKAHRKLINARFAIDLAGGGSWGEFSGPSPQCPIYVFHKDTEEVARIGWFAPWHGPSFCSRKKAWTESRLQDASLILHRLMNDSIHSRVQRASRIRIDTLSLSPMQCLIRYLSTVTALEVLFISPNKGGHLWCNKVQKRIRSALGDHAWCSVDVFSRMQSIRNDASHRGGVTHLEDPTTQSCCEWSAPDEILYRALRWAILNPDHAKQAFDSDDWSPPA